MDAVYYCSKFGDFNISVNVDIWGILAFLPLSVGSAVVDLFLVQANLSTNQHSAHTLAQEQCTMCLFEESVQPCLHVSIIFPLGEHRAMLTDTNRGR